MLIVHNKFLSLFSFFFFFYFFLQECIVVYHSHNDINHNNNTTHTQIQNAGRLCCFRYERVYQLLASIHGDTRRETQFLKVFANHTMLTPPQCMADLVMFKIWKTQLHLSTVKMQLLDSMVQSQSMSFSKSSNSQEHLFWAWHHPHSSAISCLRVYYDEWWLSYPLARKHNCTKWLCTRTEETRIVQSPTKLNDKIWLTKND